MTDNAITIAHETLGLPPQEPGWLVVWGHGWGQDRRAFAPLAEALLTRATHLVLDFPGFGASPKPPPAWGTADYADALRPLLASYRAAKKIMWVGHSFGGRVGIQLAARHPDMVDGLFLVASAGLQRGRNPWEKARLGAEIYAYKALKRLVPLFGISQERLRQHFGSADYRSSGDMKSVFVRVVREDLSEQARQVRCPARLIYGERDTETPPEIGARLEKLMRNARLSVLPGQDHYSLLGAGRHLVLKRLADFMDELR